MTEVVKIQGLSELRDALIRKIPDYMQGKVLQKALAAGSKPILQQARSLAPVDTGRLKRAIYATRDKQNSKPTYESRIVGVRSGKRFQKANKDAYYWKFVEFGHSVRQSKTATSTATRTMVPARPFMRPAFESQKANAAEAIKAQLKIEIEHAAEHAHFGHSFERGREGGDSLAELGEQIVDSISGG